MELTIFLKITFCVFHAFVVLHGLVKAVYISENILVMIPHVQGKCHKDRICCCVRKYDITVNFKESGIFTVTPTAFAH